MRSKSRIGSRIHRRLPWPDGPRGQALMEYIVVMAAIMVLWTVLDRSPGGLAHALMQQLAHYSFSLSIPW